MIAMSMPHFPLSSAADVDTDAATAAIPAMQGPGRADGGPLETLAGCFEIGDGGRLAAGAVTTIRRGSRTATAW